MRVVRAWLRSYISPCALWFKVMWHVLLTFSTLAFASHNQISYLRFSGKILVTVIPAFLCVYGLVVLAFWTKTLDCTKLLWIYYTNAIENVKHLLLIWTISRMVSRLCKRDEVQSSRECFQSAERRFKQVVVKARRVGHGWLSCPVVSWVTSCAPSDWETEKVLTLKLILWKGWLFECDLWICKAMFWREKM